MKSEKFLEHLQQHSISRYNFLAKITRNDVLKYNQEF